MESFRKPSGSATIRIIAFFLYLGGGAMIFILGANTFQLFPTNKNLIYDWAITLLFLVLAVILRRSVKLQNIGEIAGALFIASAANAINLSLGNFLKPLLQVTGNDMRFLAIDKLSQAVPIVLTIILLTLWKGEDPGSLFLRRGNLRLGLRFGLISFAVFAVIFITILFLQSSGQRTTGLFASGVAIQTILASLPWILIFCFSNSFMEELWFRGVSLGKLAPILGWTSSIIVTALVFGGTHAAATYITPAQMVLFSSIVIALGMVNAYIMLKTNSIWGSVLFHAGYDLLVIIPLLADV